MQQLSSADRSEGQTQRRQRKSEHDTDPNRIHTFSILNKLYDPLTLWAQPVVKCTFPPILDCIRLGMLSHYFQIFKRSALFRELVHTKYWIRLLFFLIIKTWKWYGLLELAKNPRSRTQKWPTSEAYFAGSATVLHKGLMIWLRPQEACSTYVFCTFVRYYVSILSFPSAFFYYR